MRTTATWAFWRRVQYGTIFSFLIIFVGGGVYFGFFYESATCFDTKQNGEERGVDCGGSCVRVCSFDVTAPNALWARAFKITEGQYNAVSYVENRNLRYGTSEIDYTFSLYDSNGLITTRSGKTVLPPDSVYPIFEGGINTGSRVPTQTFLELGNADVWQPAEAGREQFVIESRELRDTDGSPRLDASVRNTAITEAKNVEVIATIFDARGNALTSSRTVVPEFLGRASEDIVFTWPLPIAKTVRSCEVPTDTMLAIDLSGSMNDDGGTPPEPISSVLEAAKAFVDRLRQGDQAAVVTFATEALLKSQLSRNTEGVVDTISKLKISSRDETGSTNTGDAFARAENELTSERHNINARKVLVLLTDGRANAPGDDPEQYALNAAKSLRDAGVEVYVIGLGDNVNEAFLKQVASDSEHYYRAVSASTVDQIYRTITGAICEDGPAVIDIIPKTGASFTPLQ